MFSQIKGLRIIGALGHASSASEARQFEVKRLGRSCYAYVLTIPLGIDRNLEHAEGEAEYVPFTLAGFLREAFAISSFASRRHGEIPNDAGRCRPRDRGNCRMRRLRG